MPGQGIPEAVDRCPRCGCQDLQGADRDVSISVSVLQLDQIQDYRIRRQLADRLGKLDRRQPPQPQELNPARERLERLSGIAFKILVNATGADDHGHAPGVVMDLQGQLERARDVASGGYAGDVRWQFPGSDEAVVRPQEYNRNSGKQFLAVLEQEPKCRRAGRNDQVRFLVVVLVAIDMEQVADIIRIPEARHIEGFGIDLYLQIRYRGESLHNPVTPVRIHRQAVAERVQQEHPVRFIRCRCGSRRSAKQQQCKRRNNSGADAGNAGCAQVATTESFREGGFNAPWCDR